jgi:hypothetical protein
MSVGYGERREIERRREDDKGKASFKRITSLSKEVSHEKEIFG